MSAQTGSKSPRLSKPQIIVGYCFSVLFMAGGLGETGINLYRLYYGNERLSWSSCEGTIEDTPVIYAVTGGTGPIKYQPIIRYNYIVGGKLYSGDNYRYTRNKFPLDRTEKIVAAHPVGSTVTVYYAPHSPERSVLVPGTDWCHYIRIGIALTCFLLSLWLFLYIANRNGPYAPSEPVFG